VFEFNTILKTSVEYEVEEIEKSTRPKLTI